MGNTKNTTVTNSLEGGSDLTLHCKSGDNDLGVQVLHPNASFEFDIFDADRDPGRCPDKICIWAIKEDGPCLLSSPKK
ncbi:hypothetical protein AAZX31_09G238200 [Glycine max]|uniref:S-protein homolog n=2 Tax=Glycine subgen. Soja TaxID=1462606 RepID=K7LG52_SOYBN|nr:hypothetical protein JHK87_026162 [Glycine soja]KAG5008295.1 hypothetical protein JHK85_026837 [Glycine max]KAG5014086.1 hypothetical protein JHK86_026347 [Glycine max]KAG5135034.1 hypothetical protein JHK82_026222 [Glycine max]KAH1044874.1 hypothetical protein GYH30_026213 [Glycine max]